MYHGLPHKVRLEVGLGDVSNLMGPVYKDMVPGLSAFGLRLVPLVPGFRSLAGDVACHDETTIIVEEVHDHLPDLKLGRSISCEPFGKVDHGSRSKQKKRGRPQNERPLGKTFTKA